MDKNKPIAMLGGGNIGHALAADLSLGGYKVIWYEHPNMKEKFQALIDYGKVDVYDDKNDRSATAKIFKFTMDMEEALKDVDLIFLGIASYGQEVFFPEMIPHLKDNHILYILTGNSGALRLKKLMKDMHHKASPLICETNTMPYGIRVVGLGKIRFFYGFGPWYDPNPKLEDQDLPDVAAALPASRNKEALEPLQELFPIMLETDNVLTVAINNPNTSLHPTSSLLNAGRIESSGGNFYAYREGMRGSPAVQYAINYMSDELAKITDALGSKRIITHEACEKFWKFLSAPRQGKEPLDPIGPRSLKDRYITEDVPYGLLPMEGLAEKLGVDVPFISALITVGSVVCRQDFRKTGRTMGKLGIADMSMAQLMEYVMK
ncbi:NAD/NADP octopine/nopaline dehydrogenase family protein [Chloroflexota bacterium]